VLTVQGFGVSLRLVVLMPAVDPGLRRGRLFVGMTSFEEPGRIQVAVCDERVLGQIPAYAGMTFCLRTSVGRSATQSPAFAGMTEVSPGGAQFLLSSCASRG
jgi:hypothetical protein